MAQVPRFPRDDGKGYYRITAPEPFEFDRREKRKEKSIRELKLEAMIEEKARAEDFSGITFYANPIPRSTSVPRYQRLLEKEKRRRELTREQSKAKTMQNERPFKFYIEDQRR